MSAKKKPKGTSRQAQQAQAQARRTRGAAQRGGPAGTPRPQGTPAADVAIARPAAVTCYVDVAAVRIQTWLARTPGLKLYRGASALLSQATSPEGWRDHLPAGVRWNEEAGQVSGVVSLKVLPGDSPDEDAQRLRSRAADAARAVSARLLREVPYCPVQAVTGSGRSYADAYPALSESRRRGQFLLDVPAPPAEAVLAKPCDTCRSAPATGAPVAVVTETVQVCGECRRRLEAGGLTKGTWEHRSPEPEKRLLRVLRERFEIVGFSDDFYQLAIAGETKDGDAATQLALIAADGNQVGAFLKRVSAWAEQTGTPAKSDIARAIDEATVQSLADAVAETFVVHPPARTAKDGSRSSGSSEDPRVRPPVLVHLAGGDDMLVSVPAGVGWSFARSLLTAFDERMTRLAEAWSLPRDRDRYPAAPVPSLSAGIVFHHHSHPFSDVIERADARLEEAKRATRGRHASVDFLDLTSDGDQPIPGRPARRLVWLHDHSDVLADLASVPQSQRAALTALCRQASDPATTESERRVAVESLARRAVDLGYGGVWRAVAGRDATAERVRERLLDDAEARADLRSRLDLARWWPPATDETAGAAGAPRPARMEGGR